MTTLSSSSRLLKRLLNDPLSSIISPASACFISSLSPLAISMLGSDTLVSHSEKLATEFHEDRWISALQAGKTLKQYKVLISNADFVKNAKEFNITEARVDVFYSCVLDSPFHCRS